MGEKDSMGAGRGQPGRGGGAAAARKRFSGRAAGNRSTTNDANGANGEGEAEGMFYHRGRRDTQRTSQEKSGQPRISQISRMETGRRFAGQNGPGGGISRWPHALRVRRREPHRLPRPLDASRPLLWIPCVQMIRAIGVIRGGFIRAIRVIRSRHRRSVIPTVNCEP